MTVNSNTYTGGGGYGGVSAGGAGGSGTIPGLHGAIGGRAITVNQNGGVQTGSGAGTGGYGGSTAVSAPTISKGDSGANGIVTFEYMAPV